MHHATTRRNTATNSPRIWYATTSPSGRTNHYAHGLRPSPQYVNTSQARNPVYENQSSTSSKLGRCHLRPISNLRYARQPYKPNCTSSTGIAIAPLKRKRTVHQRPMVHDDCEIPVDERAIHLLSASLLKDIGYDLDDSTSEGQALAHHDAESQGWGGPDSIPSSPAPSEVSEVSEVSSASSYYSSRSSFFSVTDTPRSSYIDPECRGSLT